MQERGPGRAEGTLKIHQVNSGFQARPLSLAEDKPMPEFNPEVSEFPLLLCTSIHAHINYVISTS